MAASDDYTAVTGGGGLKLKGGAHGARIEKHKKKKKKRPKAPEEEEEEAAAAAGETSRTERKNGDRAEHEGLEEDEEEGGGARRKGKDPATANTSLVGEEQDEDAKAKGLVLPPATSLGAGKTDAERRHEEHRRRRLDERLRREGIKTHKERVEELNRYLSNLSEHHDMPRIGPG